MVLPRARIVITTKHLPVLREHYQRLSQRLPGVGLVTGSEKKMRERIMCVSSGSLHKIAPENVDLLIADEHHELATDRMIGIFSAFQNCRMFGLSANYQDRFDGADFELEGLFGPLAAQLSYDDAVKADMIVPIEVRWSSVDLPYNPARDAEAVMLKRRGIWCNDGRNRQIARDARRYKDKQILITVETLEHACYLKRYLPDFELCYSPSDSYGPKMARYKQMGLIPRSEPKMTEQRLYWLKREFEHGRLRHAIATSVWNRGVNFHSLEVLIRADGGSSAVADTQIPGRLSRLADGKEVGILIDYLDEFDDRLQQRALKRQRDYRDKGWHQVMPVVGEVDDVA